MNKYVKNTLSIIGTIFIGLWIIGMMTDTNTKNEPIYTKLFALIN